MTDRIEVTYDGDDALAAAAEAYRPMIAQGVLALSVTRGDAPEGAFTQTWDVNGKQATLSVRRA